jgi:RecA-family ATPase
MTTRRRVPRKLSTARAYWRLAAKAERAGDTRQADRYTALADRSYRAYQRDQQRSTR